MYIVCRVQRERGLHGVSCYGVATCKRVLPLVMVFCAAGLDATWRQEGEGAPGVPLRCGTAEIGWPFSSDPAGLWLSGCICQSLGPCFLTILFTQALH